MRIRGIAVLCVWLTSGCSDDGGGGVPGPDGNGGGGGCGLVLELSGAVTAMFTETPSCAAATDGGGDPIIAFRPDHPTVMRVDLRFEAAVAGTTGPGIAGELSVISDTGFVWNGDCVFDIARWEGTGTQARLAATATCEPLAPEVGMMTVTATGLAVDMF